MAFVRQGVHLADHARARLGVAQCMFVHRVTQRFRHEHVHLLFRLHLVPVGQRARVPVGVLFALIVCRLRKQDATGLTQRCPLLCGGLGGRHHRLQVVVRQADVRNAVLAGRVVHHPGQRQVLGVVALLGGHVRQVVLEEERHAVVATFTRG